MYMIKYKDLTLYNPSKKGTFLGNPTLNLELNKAGSLSFVMYPTHKLYDIIEKMASIITVYRDDKILFKGRVFSDTVNFRKEKKVEVEGLLAYFNDSIVRPYNFTGSVAEYVEFLINQHNAQVSEEQKFKKGRVTVTDPNDYITRANSALPNTWEEIEDKLLNLLGGYIVIRYEEDGNYIDYLADFENVSDQHIEFAVNLMDLENVVNSDSLSTCIIPYGAQIENENEEEETDARVDITSVNGGVDYLQDDEAVALYGKIYEVVTWDDVTSPSNLLSKARDYLANKIKLSNTLTVTAVDLHLTDEDIDSFDLGMYIPVHSSPHGIDELLLLNAYSLPLADPTGFVFSLGRKSSSFVDTQITADRKNDINVERIEMIEKVVNSSKKKTVVNITPMFYLSSSRTELLAGEWVETPPEWKEGFYYWQKLITTLADGTTNESHPMCVSGGNGLDGKDGQNGDDGLGIHSITNYYAVSTSNATAPGSFDTSVPTLTSTNKYLWNYERIIYTDGTHKDTEKRVIGVYGDTGDKGATGATGVGIKFVKEYYAVSSSNSTAPTSWGETVPTLTATDKYLWNYEVITYTNDTTYTSAKRVIGVYGDKGSTGGTGATGTGIESITVEFYLSTSKTTQTGGSWSTTMPTWSSGKYLWTRQKIVYKNPASTVYTTPICDSSWEAVNEIKPEIEEAKTVATNFLDFGGEYGDGLVIADLTKSALGRNIHVLSDRVDIRANKQVLASYRDNAVYLGLGATQASIYLCGKSEDSCASMMWNDATNDEWNRLCMHSDNALVFTANGLMEHSVAYTPDYGVTELGGSIKIIANEPWERVHDDDSIPQMLLTAYHTGRGESSNISMGSNYINMNSPNIIRFTVNGADAVSISDYATMVWNEMRINSDVRIGGKGYNDGNDGVFIDSDGFIQIQRNHASYHPYISFYLDGNDTSTADGQLRVNQSSKYMEFICNTGFKFNNNILADFVVEQGTSGDWTYRKYANGTFDAWLRQNGPELSNWTGSGSMYYDDTITLTLPFTIVSNSGVASISLNHQCMASNVVVGTNSINFRPMRGAKSTITALVIYTVLHGKWK